MQLPKHIHAWNLTPKEAIALQKELASSVRLESFAGDIKTIAGVDVSLQRFGSELFAGVIVLSFPDFNIIEKQLVKVPVPFPYVPGLLSFREIPGLLKCFEKIKTIPDIVVVDGQGIAHPRHLGIAAHLGVLLDLPTIGVAKSRLYGEYKEPQEVGESQKIIDPKTGEVLGSALKSKVNSKPLLISPGHRMTVEDAERIIRKSLRGYRLPEPTRMAHNTVNEFRITEISQ